MLQATFINPLKLNIMSKRNEQLIESFVWLAILLIISSVFMYIGYDAYINDTINDIPTVILFLLLSSILLFCAFIIIKDIIENRKKVVRKFKKRSKVNIR
jgi:cytochrome bd-type quinol oxidase subunit 2